MESEYEMYFKEYLRERRKAMGLTQEQLAKKALVSKSAVTKWESGGGIPGRANLRQLAEVLGISVDTLNAICEGHEQERADDQLNEQIVSDIIGVLRSHGYTVTKKAKDDWEP